MSARVVILGTGFAGLTVARELLRRRAPVEIVGVDRRNYHLFTPLLPEVATGSVEARHVTEPVREVLHGRAFVLGEIVSHDRDARTVAVRAPVSEERTEIAYDHLVVALGAVSATEHVPGAAEHALPLVQLDDATRVRDRIIAACEAATIADEPQRAALLTIAIVGGGFNGVEAAGELLAYARTLLRAYPQLDPAQLRVVLVAPDGLLEQLPERFGRRAARMLRRRGVEIVHDDASAVDAGGVTLRSGRREAAATVVWSAGERPSPLAARLGLPLAAHDALAVEPDLSVRGVPGVWALGDCAHVPTPGGGAYPQTAQHALREGVLLARNIDAALRGRPTSPFRYRSLGMTASLGAREGLADLGGVLIDGTPAWLLWRAYYLARLPGAWRRARVALDWASALNPRHDVARIGR